MKYNLKNPLWTTNPIYAKEAFKKEIRAILRGNKPYGPSPMTKALIKEILGE